MLDPELSGKPPLMERKVRFSLVLHIGLKVVLMKLWIFKQFNLPESLSKSNFLNKEESEKFYVEL